MGQAWDSFGTTANVFAHKSQARTVFVPDKNDFAFARHDFAVALTALFTQVSGENVFLQLLPIRLLSY